MRDFLLDEWNNYAHPELPASDRREVRGWLFEDRSTGNLVHGIYPDNSAIFPDTLVDTPCFSDGVPNPVLGIFVAGGHPHPFAAGDTLPAVACKLGLLPGWFSLYDVKTYGGASEPDMASANNDLLRQYIVDAVNVYVIPPGTTKRNAKTNVLRYPRVDPVSGCRRV